MLSGAKHRLAISTAAFYKERTEILRFAQNDNPQEVKIRQVKLLTFR